MIGEILLVVQSLCNRTFVLKINLIWDFMTEKFYLVLNFNITHLRSDLQLKYCLFKIFEQGWGLSFLPPPPNKKNDFFKKPEFCDLIEHGDGQGTIKVIHQTLFLLWFLWVNLGIFRKIILEPEWPCILHYCILETTLTSIEFWTLLPVSSL